MALEIVDLMVRTDEVFTGKSVGCPAFLPVGSGGEESRPCKHIYISRKPRPVGGELQWVGSGALMATRSPFSSR